MSCYVTTSAIVDGDADIMHGYRFTPVDDNE